MKNMGFCMLNRSLGPSGNASMVLFYTEPGKGEGGGNSSNNTNSIWAPFSFTGELQTQRRKGIAHGHKAHK